MKCITVRDYIAIRFESDNTKGVILFLSVAGDGLIQDYVRVFFFFAFTEEDTVLGLRELLVRLRTHSRNDPQKYF